MYKKIISFLFLITLFLISCSNNADTSNKENSSTNTSTTTTTSSNTDIKMPKLVDERPDEYKENTITTLNGDEVTYNMNTKKIVATFGSQDVVAFGIKLLAYEGTTDIEGYEEFYQDAEALVNSSPISSEEILSYHPELILVNEGMSLSNIKALSKIAPVIPLYTDSIDFEERLTFIGKIFGLEESANKLIEYSENLKTTMLKKVKDLGVEGKTLTIFTYFGNGISIPPDRGWFMNVLIYDYMNIQRLDNVKEFMQDESVVAYSAISAESLKDYEGDLVIFAASGEKKITTYVTENAGWKRLKAVKENRVGIIDLTPYAQKGIILLYDQYNQIYEALIEANK